MIINDLDDYYIVFDTKNRNTELDTLVNYPNIEFFADSSAILYSQADTIYRFTFFIRNDSLYLTDINGKKYVSRIRKLSSTTVIFDGIADVKKKQTYEKQ